MMRHRASSQPENNYDESSDDDDAFTALSRKRKGEAKSKDAASKKSTTKDQTESEDSSTNNKAQIESGIKSQKPLVVAQTSSTKRHRRMTRRSCSLVEKTHDDASLLQFNRYFLHKSLSASRKSKKGNVVVVFTTTLNMLTVIFLSNASLFP